MKKRQMTAIILSAVMTISSCLSTGGISAIAAEPSSQGATNQVTAEETSTNTGQNTAADVSTDAANADGSTNTAGADVTGAADTNDAANAASTTDPAPAGEGTTEEGEASASRDTDAATQSDTNTDAQNSTDAATQTNTDAATQTNTDADADTQNSTDAATQTNTDTDPDSQNSTDAVRGVRAAQVKGQEVVPGDAAGLSQDELFSRYVDEAFGLADDKGILNSKKAVGGRLTGMEGAIYSHIAGELPAIAAGRRDSTAFVIPVEELELAKTEWTAQELGLASVFVLDESGEVVLDEEGYASISEEAMAAVEERTNFNLSVVVAALLVDFPYELYWYDKVSSTDAGGLDIYAADGEDPLHTVIGISGSLTISLPVAGEYSAGAYTVDTSIGQSVSSAADTAQSIVSDYSGSSDHDKLSGYKNEICSRVSYNSAAAAGGMDYGNPWQLIWVFDGDPDTNVVCEGYSKAFKYLCDRSDFDEDIDCLIVSGTMRTPSGSEGHMWNLVSMGDGKNYLADVTNCDQGAVGEPDQLFLACSDSKLTDSERGREVGYVVYANGSEITYEYDSSTLGLYTDAEISLSATAYGGGGETPPDLGVYLTAERVSEYDQIVPPDEEFTLQVAAQTLEGRTISYQWIHDGEVLEGESSAVLTRTPMTGSMYYSCQITDGISDETIDFRVMVDSKLTVYPDGYEMDSDVVDVVAAPGSNVDLKVNASVSKGNIYYRWRDHLGSDGDVLGDGSVLTVKADDLQTYYCTVTDDYGNEKVITFNLVLTSGFYAYPEGGTEDDEYIYLGLKPGQEADLTVIAGFTNPAYDSSSIEYTWDKLYIGGSEIFGFASGSNTIHITSNDADFICTVTDGYGNYKSFTFLMGEAPSSGGSDDPSGGSGDPVPASSVNVSAAANLVYNGREQWPSVLAVCDGKTLTPGTDYDIVYAQAPYTNAGVYQEEATLNFKGGYSGSQKVSFTVTVDKAAQKLSVSPAVVSPAAGKTAAVSASSSKPGAKITFTSSNPGIASVDAGGKVTGKAPGVTTIVVSEAGDNNYKAASATVTVKVTPAATARLTLENLTTGIKLTWKPVAGATGYDVYRGSTKLATLAGNGIVKYTDKKGNKNGTTYTYKIVARSAAAGASSLSTSASLLRLARPAIKSAKNSKSRKVLLKWTKNAKGAGYVIQYSLNKNFKTAVTKTIKKKTTVSKTLSSLKKGKTYYVRVRAYKKVGSRNQYSAWSAVKKVRITK